MCFCIEITITGSAMYFCNHNVTAGQCGKHCRIYKQHRCSFLAVASVFIVVCRSTWFRRQQYQVLVIYQCLPVHSTIIVSTERACSLSCSFPSWSGSDLSAKSPSLFYFVLSSPFSAFTLEFLLQIVTVVRSKWHHCVLTLHIYQIYCCATFIALIRGVFREGALYLPPLKVKQIFIIMFENFWKYTSEMMWSFLCSSFKNVLYIEVNPMFVS